MSPAVPLRCNKTSHCNILEFPVHKGHCVQLGAGVMVDRYKRFISMLP